MVDGDGVYDFFDEPMPWKALEGPEAVAETPEFDTSGEEMFQELFDEVYGKGTPKRFRMPQEEQDYPDTEVTYVMFKDEPGFDGMYEQAGDLLEAPGGMFETFKIYPVNIS